MNDDFDDLDRALFALPLATPPPDLRAAILRATIDAPTTALAPAPFNRNEIVGLGVALALAVWLLLAAIVDHRFAVGLIEGVATVGRLAAEPTTLWWVTTGIAIAALLTLANFTPLRRRDRQS